MSFVQVPESALTQAQRDALSQVNDLWRRVPARLSYLATDLQRCGLVETKVEWVWSTHNSGAGRHVFFWRRAIHPSKET